MNALLDAAPVGLPTVAYSALPPEGQDILGRIVGSYDFDHDKDGTVFGNRERLLPAQKRGYYREYTVETPGVSHRGARRLVCGGTQPRAPAHCFYTADHYASFRQVVH
ncbi:ribonuclease domain-containing protein [Amphibiibacter pelophylacis]|uniref:ribonuclease domain-containing protein n=1 Tax=Amphibiibacter pelophylacis TaxID=1799477 RepID=UPI003BFA6F08